jgi:hypothetical protein
MASVLKRSAQTDDEYLALIGGAVYVFASVEWVVIEICRLLDPEFTHEAASAMMSGPIAARLRDALAALPGEPDRGFGSRYSELVDRRNDLIHAHPATAPDGSQVLHRWAPRKRRFESLTSEWVQRFIDDVERMSSDADALRTRIKASGS